MVRIRLQPRMAVSDLNKEDSNCEPLSVVITDGTPKFAIQCATKFCATMSVVISVNGIATGYRVNRSMHVKR